MSFINHIDELRKRLPVALIVYVVVLGAFYFGYKLLAPSVCYDF